MDQHLSSLLNSEELSSHSMETQNLAKFLEASPIQKPDADAAAENAPSPSLPERLLDGAELECPVKPQIQKQMGLFLSDPPPRSTSTVSSMNQGVQTHIPSLIPIFISLVNSIRQDLEENLACLLTLNLSRREALSQMLDFLAGLPAGPTASSGHADTAGGLRRWVDGPRSPAQNSALRVYFEEIAFITIGQAIVLKSWSDRGIRPWREEDLGKLNWVLSTMLKPHVPLDREGWQITRPNLYSWYKLPPHLQAEIWNIMKGWKIAEEGPSLLVDLIRTARKAQPNWRDVCGYDQRFFSALWENMRSFGFSTEQDTGPLRRERMAFSPTLRDGTLIRSGAASLTWIGMESCIFQLLMAELVHLWRGPTTPPLWSVGTGLEAHARDQLTFSLGSPKPSLLSRIAEIEACDLAFVFEERGIRISARSAQAARLRELLDTLPYFKKLRSPGTTLGDLQACVSLTKIRPGGLLWWAREEPLTAADGSAALAFLLEHGKLVCEWNFSGLQHSLPGSTPLFPKHLYLFSREPDMANRMEHHPTRIVLHGQIRSHIEVPVVLGDGLQGIHGRIPSREHWQVHIQQSPTSQKEWIDHWPDPTTPDTIRELERLQTESLPLASVTTVRLSPQGDPSKNGVWSVPSMLRGMFLHADYSSGERQLIASDLPCLGSETKESGFLVLVSDPTWIAPLKAYLESRYVHEWLDHQAERRGDRWILNDQIVKFIPVPKLLLRVLGCPIDQNESTEHVQAWALPPEWEQLTTELAYHPQRVKERILPMQAATDAESQLIRASFFMRTAQALQQLQNSQKRLFALVTPDGQIRWRDLLAILPRAEVTPVALHPEIRLSGMLPPHVPIGRFTRVKTPIPGILLTTEAGFQLHLGCEIPRYVEMLWAQMDGINHPTWHELAQYLKLPRHLEIAETTASDVLRSHGEQSLRLRELTELLSVCTTF